MERPNDMIKKLFGNPSNTWSDKSRKEKYEALQYAVISDDYSEIKKRISEGIDINLTEEKGESNILMYYIQNWKKSKYEPRQYVQLLIDLGIKIDHKRNEEMKKASALNYAVGMKSIEIVKTLIDNGAEIDIKEINGNTPLWRAVQEYRGEAELLEIIKHLLEHGANYDEENNYGHSPRSIVDRRHFNITEGSMKNDSNWKNWDLKPLLEE